MAPEQDEVRYQIAEARRQIDDDARILSERVNDRLAALTDWRRPLREYWALTLASALLVGLGLGWAIGR